MEDLNNYDFNTRKPLADRMRPETLDEFYGQKHIISANSFLVRAIKANSLGSCIFYGPPGTGKTSLANIIANTCNGEFRKLNAVSSGVADAKQIIDEAKVNITMFNKQTFLLLDECHRWSKAQSDCVLEAIEKGYIIFIGSTTENPYIAMTKAIVSRCKVFEFKPLDNSDIKKALIGAINNKDKGLGKFSIKCDDDVLNSIVWASCGDLRSAFNTLELAVKTTPPNNENTIVLSEEIVKECVQKAIIALDENTSYDMLSAFCKSLRGSDSDAALFYAQKLLLSGYDPLILARRLVAHASEDIGMADSNALLIASNALMSCEKLGMPECNLTLCHAIIYLCEAEKSNSVYLAMHSAQDDALKYTNVKVPNHLKNHPVGYDDKTGSYKYPHNFGGYVKQQYLPSELKDKVYYKPLDNGREKNLIRKKSKFFNC